MPPPHNKHEETQISLYITYFCDDMYGNHLLCTLASIAFPTKHLAIFLNGFSPVSPWCNMVSFHFFKLKFLPLRRTFWISTSVMLFFPYFKVAIYAPLLLNYETIALAIPFLNENGIQFKQDAVDLLRFPSPQCKDTDIERFASFDTDVEVCALFLNLTDDFF